MASLTDPCIHYCYCITGVLEFAIFTSFLEGSAHRDFVVNFMLERWRNASGAKCASSIAGELLVFAVYVCRRGRILHAAHRLVGWQVQ